MIRFIFDEHGAFTNDLFIKIDAPPTKVLVADTTWLCDFFGTHNADESPLTEDQVTLSQKGDVALLIHFWIKLLLSNRPECYLPVNLSDQSTNALRITKAKKLFHVGIASTTAIVDGNTKAYFLTRQAGIR